MNWIKLVLVLGVINVTSALAQTGVCVDKFFETLNDTVSVEVQPENSKLFRVCKAKTVKVDNLYYHLTEDSPIYHYFDFIWQTRLYYAEVEREVNGVRTLHTSTVSFINEHEITVYLDPDSLPFDFQVGGKTYLCNAVVEDVAHPSGRMDAEFHRGGGFKGCNIKSTLFTIFDQEVTVMDNISFFPNGQLGYMTVAESSVFKYPFPGTNKYLPLRGDVGFLANGDLRSGKSLPLTFLYNGKATKAEYVDFFYGLICGPTCVDAHNAQFIIAGVPHPSTFNGYRLVSENGTDRVNTYKALCRKLNPQIQPPFHYELPDYLTKKEYVEDETFYDINTGNLVRKQNEEVSIPDLSCKYKFSVPYTDLPQYLL